MERQALWQGTAIGTVLQVAMVVAGNQFPTVQQGYAIGGMGLSALAGWIGARGAAAWSGAAAAGALAGGVCALIGIGVSAVLGDVPASLLLVGTAGSTVTGALGGLLARRR